MCRTKILHNVEQDNLTLDSFHLDTIHDTEDSTFWMTDVKVNNISVTFKVDTGAEVTAVSESTLQTLGQLEVSMTDKKLCGSARHEGKPHSNFISEAAKMLPGNICESSRSSSHQRLPPIISVLDNLECDPTTAIKQAYLQGWEHSKVITRSRSSKMLSLSHLALLETSHYLFVIR